MIRLVVLMDQNGVVGDTNATKDEAFINSAPKQVIIAKKLLYIGDNVVGAPSSWNKFNPIHIKKKFIIDNNKKFKLFDIKTGVSIKTDLLIERFGASADELLVVGDLMLFESFFPHSHKVDIIQLDNTFDGNKIFKTWKSEDLVLRKSETWSGFKVLKYLHKQLIA